MKPLLLSISLLASALPLAAFAQESRSAATENMLNIIEATGKKDNPLAGQPQKYGHMPAPTSVKPALPSATQAAIAAGLSSAQAIRDIQVPGAMRQQLETSGEAWRKASLQAFIASAPDRDQPRLTQLLLADGTEPGVGRLIYFVSRSMPASLLKAYALDAMHTGADLVVKGLRKGDTIKDYIMESMEDFNSSGGNQLASLEINPNLYDTFKITVVPTVVWTNKAGLSVVGSGCDTLQEGATQMQVKGHDGGMVSVKKPECQPAQDTAYYKISGALTTAYVLDKFERAGAPAQAINHYRDLLAQNRSRSNIPNTIYAQTFNNAMPAVVTEVSVSKLPKSTLLQWQKSLVKMKVQRGPWGPAFGPDGADDAKYRAELTDQINAGLND